MANINEHEEDCIYFLNNKVTKAHKFLDHMAKYFPPERCFEYHRTFYHNSFGISLLKEALGELGEQAGLIHLVRDWYQHPIIPMSFERLMREAKKALKFFNDLTSGDYYNFTNIMKYKKEYNATFGKNKIIRECY